MPYSHKYPGRDAATQLCLFMVHSILHELAEIEHYKQEIKKWESKIPVKDKKFYELEVARLAEEHKHINAEEHIINQ